jgi:hypothetical protein
MSSYHHSFTYRDKNSFDEGLIIAAFDPDNGFMDTFLSMENISDDYYDGTKKFNYSAKYNSVSEIQITLIKKDGSDMTKNEFRNYSRWLTGARTDSWLDMYDGTTETMVTEYRADGTEKEFKLNFPYSSLIVTVNGVQTKKYTRQCKNAEFGNIPVGTLIFDDAPKKGVVIRIYETPPSYSFLGKITNFEQYKYDARTIGVKLTFSSISPWAFSIPQNFNASIAQALELLDGGIISKAANETPLGFNNGIVVLDQNDTNLNFNLLDDGTLYVDTTCVINIDNQSDDLYSYIYLDIDYVNTSCDSISIKNDTINEETTINNIGAGEIIALSSKQFIMSYTKDQLTNKRIPKESKIFGDDFNFVWPRLIPGENKLLVYGSGTGSVHFTYRYPMKIGDCAIDLSDNINC